MTEEQGRGKPLVSTTEIERGRISSEDIEKLFRSHHDRVFRAAYRVTGNASDAEDVLQTVFLRLLRRDLDSESVDHVGSYLHRAAVNAALDLLRSRQSARGVPLDDWAPARLKRSRQMAPQLVQDSILAPDRIHRSGEIRVWLRQAVARLSPRAAEIFVLRFFEGMDNPSIARALGTTESSVAVTLSRTRDRMQKEFRSAWENRHEA